MLTYEKQALSGAIEVLSRSELPDTFAGTKLYGSPEEAESGLHQDCKIFRLSNETGHGRIAVYQVFSGIELYYNDMHMGYCNQNQTTAKNMIEINHCLVGRFECSFGENSCCYMAEGDLSISSMMKKKSNSCFPLNHYHGISIIINLDELLPEDYRAVERAISAGIHVFASAHLVRFEDVPEKIFDRYLFLSGVGQIRKVCDACGNALG